MKQLDEQKLEAILAMRNTMVKVAAMLNEAAVNYDRAMGDRVTGESFPYDDSVRTVLETRLGKIPGEGLGGATNNPPGESWQIGDHEFSETEVE